jgi:hypothetical protein
MAMVHPVAVLIEEARYRELLRKAEVEQRFFMAGPAEAARPLAALGSVLLALGIVLNR